MPAMTPPGISRPARHEGVTVGSGSIVGQHSFDGGSSSMSLFNDVFKERRSSCSRSPRPGVQNCSPTSAGPKSSASSYAMGPLVGLLAGHGLGRQNRGFASGSTAAPRREIPDPFA